MLKQTLLSISAQNYPSQEIEVFIVSQTPEILNQSILPESNLDCTILIRPETDTISALRNFGVQQANGKYLAFLDADISISSNWIESMLTHLNEDPQRIIVSAMQVCPSDAPPLEKIRTSLSNADIDTNVSFLPGRNLFISRSSFEKIGGFPEHLITCEDYYFTDKASKLGVLYYTSSATYIHIGEDKVFSEMFKKEIWRGQSNLQSIKGRQIPTREIPSFILPIWICLTLFIAAISAATGQGLSASILLILGLTPLLAYTLRLYRLTKGLVNIITVFKFYVVYFPARAIGTFAGLFKAIGANHK